MAKRKPKAPTDAARPKQCAGPSTREPWLATKQAEIAADGGTLCYLLVDLPGAELIRDGVLPDFLKEQARRMLEWNS